MYCLQACKPIVFKQFKNSKKLNDVEYVSSSSKIYNSLSLNYFDNFSRYIWMILYKLKLKYKKIHNKIGKHKLNTI